MVREFWERARLTVGASVMSAFSTPLEGEEGESAHVQSSALVCVPGGTGDVGEDQLPI